MKANLSYETALATLKVIDQYAAADFDTLGISQQDFELVSDRTVWLRPHLPIVMRTLNALIFGTLEVQGISKIVVPSEYVAAIVASFVAPSNRMLACTWLAQERQTGVGAIELSARAQATAEVGKTSGDQLFALVLQLSNHDASSEARRNFRNRLGLAQEQAERAALQ